jgi:hypothetical protein
MVKWIIPATRMEADMTEPKDPQTRFGGEAPAPEIRSRFTEYALLGLVVVLSPVLAYKKFGASVAQSAERSTKALEDIPPQHKPPKPPAPK